MKQAMDSHPFATGPVTGNPDLDRLLHPALCFRHPDDVVADMTLALSEKRAILASWASDACAVESAPALRSPPGAAAPVSFDDIMDALARLDASQGAPGNRAMRQKAGDAGLTA